MPVLYYLLKLSLGLIIIWLFYQLVLRRLTFYVWNRWYLVVCPALAFLLPLINISPVLEKNNWTQSRFVSVIPNIPVANEPVVQKIIPVTSLPEQMLHGLPFIIAAGAVVMLIRLLFQYYSLVVMRQSSKLILNGPVKVYQVNKPVIPFSFGNAIYLNQDLHGEEELKEIIRHEFIHVKQRHSFDIIWSEFMCILTWYNPFSWLLRKAIRQNLEFIADQQVLKTGVDRRQYQYLLLKVIGAPAFTIASNFNFKSLKKRIAMMNKVKSARVHLVRFALLLPVVVILLVAFRNAAQHRQQPAHIIAVTDTLTPPKNAFPENVQSIHSLNNQVTVTLKNGKVEKYNFNKEEEQAAFEKKYGQFPEPPSPAAPPAPIEANTGSPAIVAEPIAPVAPSAAGPAIIADAPIAVFTPDPEWAIADGPHQDDCYNEKGYCLSVIHTRKGAMVLVLQKSKKEPELIYLEDWNKDRNKYEEKYGKLLPPPPPPPPAPARPRKPSPPVREDETGIHGSASAHGETQVVLDEVVTVGKHINARVEPVVVDEVVTVGYPAQASVSAKEVHGYSKGLRPAQERGSTEEQEILAVITNNTTSKDLEQLKKDLTKKGITVDWRDITEHDGQVIALKGHLQSTNDKCDFDVSRFRKITISRGRKGFHIYVTDGTATVHSITEKKSN